MIVDNVIERLPLQDKSRAVIERSEMHAVGGPLNGVAPDHCDLEALGLAVSVGLKLFGLEQLIQDEASSGFVALRSFAGARRGVPEHDSWR